jgi:hypothetical protein
LREGSKGIENPLKAYIMAFFAGTFALFTLQEGRGLRLLVIGYTFSSVMLDALARETDPNPFKSLLDRY